MAPDDNPEFLRSLREERDKKRGNEHDKDRDKDRDKDKGADND